jgi:hypothetical protein
MTIHAKMSLHVFGSGYIGHSTVWRKNIKIYHSQTSKIISTIYLIFNMPNEIDVIGTSQASTT